MKSKVGRFLFACAILLGSAVGVWADSIAAGDPPKLIVGRGGSTIPVFLLNVFEPVAIDPSGGGGVSEFSNQTGQVLTGLTVDVIFKNFGDANGLIKACNSESIKDPSGALATNIFTNCQADLVGKKEVKFIFGGGTIEPGSDFFVDLNTKDKTFAHSKSKVGDWKGDKISVAVMTPEPGSVVLVFSGLAGIWIWRRRG